MRKFGKKDKEVIALRCKNCGYKMRGPRIIAEFITFVGMELENCHMCSEFFDLTFPRYRAKRANW